MHNLTTENFTTVVETTSAECATVPCIVCLSDLFWDEHWSSEQQIMSRLAKRCRILYIERPISVFSSLTGVSDTSIMRQVRRWLTGGIRQETENLTIVTPQPVFPLRYNRWVSKINCWILRRSVKRALQKTGLKNPVLWIYSPDTGDVVGTLGESYSLYYCADDWAALDQWWNHSDNIRTREIELASKVDLVVGTSTKIVKRWQQTRKQTMLVRNGADVDSFKAARDLNLALPGDLTGIPSPRIGYVGCIDSRFDSALYLQLAEKHPEWHFVIVGRVTSAISTTIARLKEMSNVHFLGAREKALLPAYLKGFDVCTIPYVQNTLSESIFPLKFFEYLSAGRPIVSTNLPELLPYAQYAHVTQTPEAFEQAIGKSLSNPLPTAPESFLNQNSWQAKADAMWERLQLTVPALASK